MSVTDRIHSLQQKHEELDRQLHSESTRPHPDENTLARLKREKLALKDQIANLS